MSPAPTQDSMGYSLGSGGYDPQQAYDGSMGYDPSLHQDLSPWGVQRFFFKNKNKTQKLESAGKLQGNREKETYVKC